MGTKYNWFKQFYWPLMLVFKFKIGRSLTRYFLKVWEKLAKNMRTYTLHYEYTLHTYSLTYIKSGNTMGEER
jgi:hypothetical protein